MFSLWCNMEISLQPPRSEQISRGNRQEGERNVIISTNFWASLWWYAEPLVGTKIWEDGVLQLWAEHFICSFLLRDSKCNKRLSWILMCKATSINIQMPLSEEIILSSLCDLSRFGELHDWYMKDICIKLSYVLKCLYFSHFVALKCSYCKVHLMWLCAVTHTHSFLYIKKSWSEIWCTCVLQWTLFPWGSIFGG